MTSKTEFNPASYMVKLQGRDYLPVAAALAWANAESDSLQVHTEILTADPTCIIKATVSIGNKSATAHASGKLGGAKALEKLETTAIGRAIRMLGYGTLQAGDELDEAEYNPESEQRPAPAIDKQLQARKDAIKKELAVVFKAFKLDFADKTIHAWLIEKIQESGVKMESYSDIEGAPKDVASKVYDILEKWQASQTQQ